MRADYRVLLDACVLIPMPVADTLLRMAGAPAVLAEVGLSAEWMMRTRDGHAFGKLLMMGSVWWFP
ncbi:MAG: hypothetical protein ACKV22_29215 [Bryobacteraceae bacterium]